jgi:DNA-directed RNA polymerase I, II, and III subunit RPABC2
MSDIEEDYESASDSDVDSISDNGSNDDVSAVNAPAVEEDVAGGDELDEDEDDYVDGDGDDEEEQEGGELSYGGGDPENDSDNEGDDEDDDEYDDVDESYLQKFNEEINKNYILDFHPECSSHNYDEINALSTVVRDSRNNIVDDLHKTLPYLTKYERAKILGQRTLQINSGAKVFVKVPENIIDGRIIAELELKEKRIPFIIKRPLPGGGCEYWRLKDLEIISF